MLKMRMKSQWGTVHQDPERPPVEGGNCLDHDRCPKCLCHCVTLGMLPRIYDLDVLTMRGSSHESRLLRETLSPAGPSYDKWTIVILPGHYGNNKSFLRNMGKRSRVSPPRPHRQ